MTLTLADITPCPWNTRGEISEESVKELAQSISETGLLSPIVVWRRTDGDGWYCIAGCRRLAAMKSIDYDLDDAEWTEYEGDEAAAKRITIIENLQREATDPISEALLVCDLIEGGMDAADIAAAIGKSEAWVRRRSLLAHLDARIVEAARKTPSRFTVAALEMVAMMDVKQQAEIAGRVLPRFSWNDYTFTAREAKAEVDRLTLDLDTATFIAKSAEQCAKCQKCDARTGCQADLFGVFDGKLGRCLDVKCFKASKAVWELYLVTKAIKASGGIGGDEVVRIEYAWQMPDEKTTTAKRDKDHPCAYVFVYAGEAQVRWGASKKQQEDERKAHEAERDAARAEEAKRATRVRAVEVKLDEAFNDVVDDNAPKELRKTVADAIADKANADAVRKIVLDWLGAYHDSTEWAWMLRKFDWVAEYAKLTDDDKQFLIAECGGDDEE